VSTADKNSNRRREKKAAQEKLQAPWYIHLYVWIFMTALGVSPVLYVLGTQDGMQSGETLRALVVVLLIQGLLWIAQRRCSSDDLSYWDGLLAASAAMTTGIAPISLLLSCCILLLTVAASFLFALTHDSKQIMGDASIRFRKLIIAIHRHRLYR
jgi:hypothetical protein